MIELKPIRNEAQHKAALKEIERLWGCKRGTPDGDRFEVLGLLVENYEREHYPLGPSDPIEAIKFRMEQMGYTRVDLEPSIGSRGRVSDVLNRRRPLTLAMIRRISEQLSISAEVLIQPTVKKAKKGERARAA
ncbi:type II toxin-antitoxin system HigA family antitoxin [Hyphomicrobium sp. 99]|uniref:helix-turn-helix domain-containing protein n=1 Tax=Hyphomicrobium sp. 99 TaxID=1163419 RepID=UPI0005F77074|nr:DNA-binding protein [Hyphomicrobium sp. 99]